MYDTETHITIFNITTRIEQTKRKIFPNITLLSVHSHK